MRRGVERILLVGLLAATAAAYLPCVDGEFLLDDEQLLGDPLVLDPFAHGAQAWLAAPRPLATLTFALNRLAVGPDTRGWHLTNLAIHLAAVLLAWLFVRTTLARAGLSRPALPALAAAALFALHPLQTESVAYVIQRSEALASGLYLAAFLFLLARDGAPPTGRRSALLAGALVSQGLGLLAKPIVATLPVAWLLHAAVLPPPEDASLTAWERVRRRLPASAPLFALSVASAAWQLAGTRDSGSAGLDIPGLSPLRYFATQLRAIPTYLRLAVWPAGQCADWDFPASAGLGDPWTVAGGLLLLAIAAGAALVAARAARRAGDGPAAARAGAFGLLFFLVALAPSSSVVPLLDPLAEHRVYLGLVGLAAGAAAGGAWLVRRLAGGRALLAGGAVVAALLLALGLATARRSAVWTTRLAFWTATAERAPGKARVQLNLGASLFYERRFEEALSAYRRARAAGDPSVSPAMILGNIVGTLVMLERADEARAELAVALRAEPRSEVALGLLALVEYEIGDPAAAEPPALRALASDPENPRALKYLGFLRADRGDLASARELLQRATAAPGVDTSVFRVLGAVEERLGNRSAACAAYLRAATEPGWGDVAARARTARDALGCR